MNRNLMLLRSSTSHYFSSLKIYYQPPHRAALPQVLQALRDVRVALDMLQYVVLGALTIDRCVLDVILRRAGERMCVWNKTIPEG